MIDKDENNQFNDLPGNFGLPEGYFQKSAGSIMNKIEWQEEHKKFPRLSALKNVNAFAVPENYFSENEHQLELMDYPALKKLERVNAFSVPQNYFAELEVIELAKVLVNEENVFPILQSFDKKNNFVIPENYFEKTEKLISEKVDPKKRAKVISLFTKKVSLAAAAMFVVVIGLWLYNFYFVPIEPVDCGTIACLDKQDIVKSKSIESLDDDQLYDLVDPSALEKKLDAKKADEVKDKSQDSSINNLLEEEDLEDI
ncbi:hypothetical protein CNR22_05630 [Sphingobacteriaceae bacterium]|nr:hypothetical protein CNR22_05630 [Sphingobacteriaceae bacterium]